MMSNDKKIILLTEKQFHANDMYDLIKYIEENVTECQRVKKR